MLSAKSCFNRSDSSCCIFSQSDGKMRINRAELTRDLYRLRLVTKVTCFQSRVFSRALKWAATYVLAYSISYTFCFELFAWSRSKITSFISLKRKKESVWVSAERFTYIWTHFFIKRNRKTFKVNNDAKNKYFTKAL